MKKPIDVYFVTILLLAMTFGVVLTISHDSHDNSLNSHDHHSSHNDVFDEMMESIGRHDSDYLETEHLDKIFKNLHLKSCLPFLTPGCNSVSSFNLYIWRVYFPKASSRGVPKRLLRVLDPPLLIF